MAENVNIDEDGIKMAKDESSSIGSVVWYSVGATLIPQSELYEFLNKKSINEDIYPNEISDKNAFKRATKDLEGRTKEKVTIDYRTIEADVEYMIRSLKPSVRHLVREVKDKQGNKLDYSEMMEFRFENGEVISEPIEAEENLVIMDWREKMNKAYKKYRNSFTERDIRRLLRRILDDVSSTQVRASGGVYFVPIQYVNLIKKFQKIFERLNNDEYSLSEHYTEIVNVPMADDPERREMVERKINEDIVDTASDKIKEFKDKIEDGSISSKQFSKFAGDIRNLKEKRQEYETILEKELESSKYQIDMMEKQLKRLGNSIEE